MKINEIIGMIFISLAVLMFFFSLLGFHRFKYVLNRMQTTGLSDTVGLLFLVIGISFISGFDFKLVLIIVFMWIVSPIQSHFIARVERMTNSEYKKRIKGRK